ncbi:MAG: amidohydrolase [Pseudonocardia sp.]|uniref:amidohydrolase family protein n=1 Tax=unclassified Pseudonocardia TaxID=2619320 RepID=UPI00086B15C0|nr:MULTISPECIES: amidohydrolase family protein [unclassified Pseudonocardia]MBN9109356.1 amidohydrolase [Pseudonocardia sp.]ODU29506.1 MAG: hypothetical protein ABS80_01750 [Pseudonocardia sp. SCN 72-51]ODV08068.1 MAG: hypothetical protein ABT15_05090 [Pseudonocardia sp. SCN 73-27]
MTIVQEAAASGTGQSAATGLQLVDTDVHNICMSEQLKPYMAERWWDYLTTYGLRTRHDSDMAPYLRPMAARADSIPPNGMPGSDPEFTKAQHLDAYGIDVAILNNIPGQVWHVGGAQPLELSAALLAANNEWAMNDWFTSDPRWRASICSAVEDGTAAVTEIERCIGLSDRFVQIIVPMRTQRPFGHYKYWPLLEAAAGIGLPLAFHPGGTGMNQITGSGWPSYYFEHHAGYPQSMVSQIASLIAHGVFDRWPDLKIVVTEGGWSWVAPVAWRLDASWRVLREEVPHLQRKPSEYLREHFWFTTQPAEEPEDKRWHVPVVEQFESLGLENRLMYSSDYPHWDFDAPDQAVPKVFGEERRRRIMVDNAAALYGFGGAA